MDAATLLQLVFGAVGAGAGVGIFYRLGRVVATVEGMDVRITKLEDAFAFHWKG